MRIIKLAPTISNNRENARNNFPCQSESVSLLKVTTTHEGFKQMLSGDRRRSNSGATSASTKRIETVRVQQESETALLGYFGNILHWLKFLKKKLCDWSQNRNVGKIKTNIMRCVTTAEGQVGQASPPTTLFHKNVITFNHRTTAS